MFAPLKERNYRLWAAADLVSVGGTWMQVLALNWVILSVTGSATKMGAVVMLQSLPVLLLGSWGGALADRIPARPMLIACQAIRALLALALMLPTGNWMIYGVALASGVIGSFEGPVLGRFGSSLIPREALASALALGSVLSSAGRIGGMALGGVLIGITGPTALFLINAVSYIGVIFALLAMRTGEMRSLARASASDGGVIAGLRYVLRQPVVLIVLALSFVLGSLGRNYQVSMAAMVSGPLGGSSGSYGLLSTAFAVGAVAGGLLLAGSGKSTLRVLLGTGFLISVLQFASGLAPNVLGFAALILPIAAGAVVFDTVVSTRIQLDTAESMRGRVLATVGIVSSLSGIVGAPAIGWMCDSMGARGALLLAGAVTTAAAVAGGVALARVKGRSLNWNFVLGRPVEQPA
ncbi:putative MFS transporter [Actinoplanes missouriensis 431]|uniref:Putative MFS transporter n=1 Tax=Actinoplanes missouriensis (strain ATCC 14538 / DSM 43046 / CBS 188.64 / JCM 3121 / NBRC 102363 / NCIMB 12654 / NRRL B-3342 / UNCC 431) TaxID=512565 RepID=I0HJD0_ACTM4|nr:MFS transporter [Actinoplanes missouriensis]BAL93117.1 putative MFS transporter [Actinoplanes missouriensis 431]